MKNRLVLLFAALFSNMLLGVICASIFASGIYLYFEPQLPVVDKQVDFELEVPLRVYTKDGKLMAEYGVQRRLPVAFEDLPKNLINAVLAAEDTRFFNHPGVDYQGLARATIATLKSGRRSQGGSTITMQVARNFFLTPEKSYERKLLEIFLSFKLERELSKAQILELYLNKIYLGNRAYGVAAAAQVYYSKELAELSLAQLAMIAGLPKAPSAYNPIANPERALERRNDYILPRMLELGFIQQDEYDQALVEPVTAVIRSTAAIEVDANYLGEMVRQEMIRRYGDKAYTDGFSVYTTVNSTEQAAANRALKKGLMDYDIRHGYRGPEGQLPADERDDADAQRIALLNYSSAAGLEPAAVTQIGTQTAQVLLQTGEIVTLNWPGLQWARRHINADAMGPKPSTTADILNVGDIIRVLNTPTDDGQDNWRLSQIPTVQGALVAVDPTDSGIRALVGGFDFYLSKFNRASMAQRQPGSSFKPFLYSAALEKGYTTATIINDAPVVFEDDLLEKSWRPENYSGKFFGPTRLRKGLVKSRNLVSIRIMQDIGIKTTIRHAEKFGFQRKRMPRDLSLSLGSATVTPLELASAYATFANGGYRVKPYVIDHILRADGSIEFIANPKRVCNTQCRAAQMTDTPADVDPTPINPDQTTQTSFVASDTNRAARVASARAARPLELAPRIIPAGNAYLMTSMLRDVVRHGTAKRAMKLGRYDLAGKTGTTNDQKDAWFAGFNGNLVGVAWIGFDKIQTLGGREAAGRAALPIWIDFMAGALKDQPQTPLIPPPGIVKVKISPKTGLRTAADNPNGITESFRGNNVPPMEVVSDEPTPRGTSGGTLVDELF